MSNTKQTAVDWLYIELNNQKFWADPIRCANLFIQAKAMEREQIMNCCIETTQSCYVAVMVYLNEPLEFTNEDLNNQKLEAEQYYIETYGE